MKENGKSLPLTRESERMAVTLDNRTNVTSDNRKRDDGNDAKENGNLLSLAKENGPIVATQEKTENHCH